MQIINVEEYFAINKYRIVFCMAFVDPIEIQSGILCILIAIDTKKMLAVSCTFKLLLGRVARPARCTSSALSSLAHNAYHTTLAARVLAKWRLDQSSLPTVVVMSLVKVGWNSWRYHDSVALVGPIRILRLPSVALLAARRKRHPLCGLAMLD